MLNHHDWNINNPQKEILFQKIKITGNSRDFISVYVNNRKRNLKKHHQISEWRRINQPYLIFYQT